MASCTARALQLGSEVTSLLKVQSMRIHLVLLLALTLPFIAASQTPLFSTSETPRRVATKHANDTQGLRLNEMVFQRLRTEQPQSILIKLPMPNGDMAITQWESFCNVSPGFTVGRQTTKGLVHEPYFPRVLTY